MRLRTFLNRLEPQTPFRLSGMPEVTGVLLACNECSAKVRVDEPIEEFDADPDDEDRPAQRRRTKTTTWAPLTLVEPLTQCELEELEMAKKKAKTARQTKSRKQTASQGKRRTAKKKPVVLSTTRVKPAMSMLDAAVKVLKGAGKPMTCGAMMSAILARNYWTTNGKTPAATLYSAILREINNKPKETRFKKTSAGHFALKD